MTFISDWSSRLLFSKLILLILAVDFLYCCIYNIWLGEILRSSDKKFPIADLFYFMVVYGIYFLIILFVWVLLLFELLALFVFTRVNTVLLSLRIFKEGSFLLYFNKSFYLFL